MTQFDDIRPYYPEEVPAAMRRMADSDALPSIAQYLMPDVPVEEFRERLRNIQTVEEFQSSLLMQVVDILSQKTTTQLDWSGMENIVEKKPYLFVSNHRDIVMDAMSCNIS